MLLRIQSVVKCGRHLCGTDGRSNGVWMSGGEEAMRLKGLTGLGRGSLHRGVPTCSCCALFFLCMCHFRQRVTNTKGLFPLFAHDFKIEADNAFVPPFRTRRPASAPHVRCSSLHTSQLIITRSGSDNRRFTTTSRRFHLCLVSCNWQLVSYCLQCQRTRAESKGSGVL